MTRLAWLGLMVALLATLVASAPAGANLSVQPTYEDGGEPSDVFTSNQALWGVGLADVQGGDICVVSANLNDPGTGGLDCSSPAWGSKNHVAARIGTFWTPLEGPYLRTGTWKLLADGYSEPSVDRMSTEFFVFPCDPGNCDTRLAEQQLAAAKAAAANMALSMAGMQGITGLLTKVNPTEPFGVFKNWLNGVVKKAAQSSSIFMRFLAKEAEDRLKPVNDIPDGPNAMALSLLTNVVGGALKMYVDIVNDPPQDYAEVAEPAFDIPTLSTTDAQLDAMVLDIAQLTGYGTAMRIAMERYQLAALENSNTGVHRQAKALAENGFALVDEMYDAAAGFETFAGKLATNPDWAGAKVVQEHVEVLRPFVARMKPGGAGYHADEVAELETLGFDATGRAALREQLAGVPLDDVPIDTPIETVLEQAAASLRTEAVTFDALARNAEAVAQSTNTAPDASFTASPQQGPPPLHVDFTSTATDPDSRDELTVTWDFGDGSPVEEGPTAAHDFALGTWTVTQTVTDGHVTDTATRTITVANVNQAPTAAFTPSPSSGLAPLPVSFDATASDDPDGDIVSYDWEFGDGATGQGATAEHIYQAAGSYQAKLTVTDDGGKTGTVTKTITVSALDNQPPTASFTATPQAGEAPLSVAFDAAGSSDSDGQIVSYEWTFGDGAVAAGAQTQHQYGGGLWTATLKVTDDDGATATTTRQIDANALPVAAFTLSRTTGHAPLLVQVDATSSSDAGGSISTYQWDFGDGAIATGITAGHTYTQAGTYTITLTVTDDDGATATTAQSVFPSVNVAPNAGFTASTEIGPPPLHVTFTDTSSDANGDPLEIDWDFGDGGTGSGSPAAHTFTAAGVYTVTQTVSDGDETATATKVVRVTAPPVAAFTAAPLGADAPVTVNFDASGSSDPDGTIASYLWEYGDGGTSTEQDSASSHLYTQGGEYTAKLTVTDDLGVKISVEHAVRVMGPPVLTGETMTVTGSGVVDVLQNDMHPNELGFRIVGATEPEHGTATCTPLGGCLYVADAGYTGGDEFAYTVRDEDGRQATATVTVGVQEPQTPAAVLLARDDELTTRQGVSAGVSPLLNDTGAAPLTIAATGTPKHGTVSCQPTGACTYTPATGYFGTDGFTYTLKDGTAAEKAAAVRITVVPAAAGFPLSVDGRPESGGAVRQGELASWTAGAGAGPDGIDGDQLSALPVPRLVVDLTGEHAVEPGSLKLAPGWGTSPGVRATQSGAVSVQAGPGALLGESVSDPLQRPLPPISQGTGGDGHVPILVGSKVFAFYHHQFPTAISCADRLTGALCPGYPKSLAFGANDIPGPAAVVGTKFYVHLHPAAGPLQTAPVGLFCWDSATDASCGFPVLDRVASPNYIDGSAPIVVDGKIYMAAASNKLYCYDPAVSAPCATASLPLGMADVAGSPGMDILNNGSRVYVTDRSSGEVTCVDVSAKTACAGWTGPRSYDNRWNLVRRHDASGAVSGMCVVVSGSGRCWSDATPAAATAIDGWPATDDYYMVTQEAETGTRTLVASLNHPGAGCYDWATLALCTGGAWGADGFVSKNVSDEALPSAYGITWDGSCAVGLGDPGLIFTVDADGSAPCTSLGTGTAPQSVDLREQRCDNTIGAAHWTEVALLDTPASGAGTELVSLVVTVRAKATGAQLLKQEMIGGSGTISLSGIDPGAHPALTLEAAAISKPGDPAWADGIPPRIRLRWQADPRQLCFKTRAAVRCGAAPADIGVGVSLAGVPGVSTRTLGTVRSTTCNDPPTLELGADRTVDEETALAIEPAASDPQGAALSFALTEGPPGLGLDAATGRITWTPSESQGPGAYPVRVKVTDAGGLTAQDTVAVNVAEVNRRPTIEPLAAVKLTTGDALSAAARASDPDVPANALSFSVVSPVGPKVDAASGAISWTPAAPGNFPVVVRVTDNGVPPLSAESRLDVAVEKSGGALLLECAKRDLVLEDVVISGRKVELMGIADTRYAGRTVEIVYEATGMVVAKPTVGPDGSFRATAPLPTAKTRRGNKARYIARIDSEKSLNLKLARRLVISAISVAGRRATFSGRVLPPLAAKRGDRRIEIRRRLTCGKDEVVGTVTPKANGRFTANVDAPANASVAIYRFRTKVRQSSSSRKAAETFTLPRIVEFTAAR